MSLMEPFSRSLSVNSQGTRNAVGTPTPPRVPPADRSSGPRDDVSGSRPRSNVSSQVRPVPNLRECCKLLYLPDWLMFCYCSYLVWWSSKSAVRWILYVVSYYVLLIWIDQLLLHAVDLVNGERYFYKIQNSSNESLEAGLGCSSQRDSRGNYPVCLGLGLDKPLQAD